MKVLVVYGSKHGSTREIAERITDELKKYKLNVDLITSDTGADITNYQAVVIGSGVYAGNWVGKAKNFIEANSTDLVKTKVWLFSVGPIGDPLKPGPDKAVSPELIKELKKQTSAIEHKLLAGSLNMKNLNFGEKLIVKAFKTPEGDYRNWDEISDWAKKIAKSLKA
ncbi:MAG: flavodoxin domain-containing protein [Candidatus Saccharibacteria bacterium]